jgi:hypothetical protein
MLEDDRNALSDLPSAVEESDGSNPALSFGKLAAAAFEVVSQGAGAADGVDAERE